MKNIKIIPGGDPRAYIEADQVRDEMAKLSHPARPDVDWDYVAQCCEALFSKNGVDLRTAAFYTVARGHQAGLSGLSEGLSIVSSLVSRFWAQIWPQQTHTRIELLSWLSGSVLQRLRALSLNYSDLPAVYRAEKEVTQLCSTLQLLELKQLSRLEQIQHWLQQAAVTLEHVDETSADVPPSGQAEPAPTSESVREAEIPPTASHTSPPAAATVAIPQPERRAPEKSPVPVPSKAEHKKPTAKAAAVPPSELKKALPVSAGEPLQEPAQRTMERRRPGFITGFLCALALAAIAVCIAWWLTRPVPTQALFDQVAPIITLETASDVARAGSQLTPAALQTIREPWLKALDEKLMRIAALPPLWKERQSRALLLEAQALWPDAQELALIGEREQQRREALAVPSALLGDWHLAQQRLEALTQRLNALDERRGRWLTGSELKTAIFDIRQALDKTPPLEELLRQLAEQQAAGANTAALRKQIDDRFNQLLNRYALLDESVPAP